MEQKKLLAIMDYDSSNGQLLHVLGPIVGYELSFIEEFGNERIVDHLKLNSYDVIIGDKNFVNYINQITQSGLHEGSIFVFNKEPSKDSSYTPINIAQDNLLGILKSALEKNKMSQREKDFNSGYFSEKNRKPFSFPRKTDSHMMLEIVNSPGETTKNGYDF